MSIRNFVSRICEKSALGLKIREFYRKKRAIRNAKNRRKRLRKHGAEILSVVYEVCRSLEVPFFADYGTLLGYVREGGFIRHDDDIDFSVMPGFNRKIELVKALIAKGFVFRKGFECDGRLTEYAFYYKDVSVDFFFPKDYGGRIGTEIYSTGGVIPLGADRIKTISAVRAYRSMPGLLKEVVFEGARTFIPENSNVILSESYGPHWRNPVPNWRPSANDPNRETLCCDSYVLGLERVISGALR